MELFSIRCKFINLYFWYKIHRIHLNKSHYFLIMHIIITSSETNLYNPYHKITTNKYGVWLSRLRIGLSALNSHCYSYNFINSHKCPTCNEANKNVHHYFISCPTYQVARQIVFNQLQKLLGIDTTKHQNLLLAILEGRHIHPGIMPNYCHMSLFT